MAMFSGQRSCPERAGVPPAAAVPVRCPAERDDRDLLNGLLLQHPAAGQPARAPPAGTLPRLSPSSPCSPAHRIRGGQGRAVSGTCRLSGDLRALMHSLLSPDV